MKPVEEMAPDEMRSEIAERLGYANVRMAIMPGQVRKRLVGDYSPTVVTAIPNWPEDSGAALELCMEIADRIVQELSIGVEAGRYDAMYDNIGVNDQQTLALALSRLALAVLRSAR